ncbi:MAG: SPOR domain-containing protein [Halioglobus sp.]
MARHKDNQDEDMPPGFDSIADDRNQRREPGFSAFDEDEDDDYEEPDRDTDFTSAYRAEDVEEEEEFDDALPTEEAGSSYHTEETVTRAEYQRVVPEPEAWLDKEEYLNEEDESGQTWPLGLIAVAIVAVALLAAGGYGVMQQRAATEEELRHLRAELASASSNKDGGATRAALEELKQSYDKLAANAEALALENRRLADTVAGLEAQQETQQAVLTKTLPAVSKTATPAPDPTPAAVTPQASTPQPAAAKPLARQPNTPESAPAQPVAGAADGAWFVNFGSYALRSMAETWATRLHPAAGKVIIAPSEKDGKTLYRVRVVGLANRDSAQEVARKLESDLRVSQLWVGKE